MARATNRDTYSRALEREFAVAGKAESEHHRKTGAEKRKAKRRAYLERIRDWVHSRNKEAGL